MSSVARLRPALLLSLVLSAGPVAGQGGDRVPVRPGPSGEAELFAPADRDGFTFAVFGDRTGGPVEGLAVLRSAVAEVNRLDPDFVMTVGDLINGYNQEADWLAQAAEYRSIMGGLTMPWFPVAGNHDVYGFRGDAGDRTNLQRYLDHFGPLYYSFDHRDSHFVVLFSDEALSFRRPAVDQNVSAEQLEWLRKDLAATRARSIFVFLHHPRWIERYEGSNWPVVHELFVRDGRVGAVFAGHIHRYRFDEADGIDYYTLATTGAHVGSDEEVGQLHHYNLVTVRRDGFRVAVLPVGSVRAGDFVLGSESEDVIALRDSRLGRFTDDLVEGAPVGYWLRNPTRRPVAYRFLIGGEVVAEPVVEPKEACEAAFEFPAAAARRLVVEARYTLRTGRVHLVRIEKEAVDRSPRPVVAGEDGVDRALVLDGRGSCVRIDPSAELLPTGPFTIELWARPDPGNGPRSVLASKAESSAYGLFHDEGGRGEAAFFVHAIGRGYAGVRAPQLPAGRWSHLAAAWDGRLVRLFVDGRPVASVVHPGDLTPNDQPLYVGADPDPEGRPVSCFRGRIDEFRLSRGVRYAEAFEPARRHEPDEATVVLLRFDEAGGEVAGDASGRGHFGRFLGEARRAPRED